MDDENIVKLENKQLSGQEYYVSTNRANVSNKFEFVLQGKFAK